MDTCAQYLLRRLLLTRDARQCPTEENWREQIVRDDSDGRRCTLTLLQAFSSRSPGGALHPSLSYTRKGMADFSPCGADLAIQPAILDLTLPLSVLLGIGEAGYYAGMIYYLSFWYRRHELAMRIRCVLTCNPTVVVPHSKPIVYA